tara:strand:+ start:361 stop:591 length:231 start_codon:yes stop_codon:yes gene_type:complete
MSIKEKAAGIKRLLTDEAYTGLINEIKKDQSDVFLDPQSSTEEREEAHTIVRAIGKIEDRIARILQDEAIYDKKQR